MAKISLRDLLPERFRPDDSAPVAAWKLPPKSAITRVGFDRQASRKIVYEDESPIQLRLCERNWRYRYAGQTSVESDQRWRLELIVDSKEAGPLEPGHVAVVAQEPHANGWVQYSVFKHYSKKKDRPEPELPANLAKGTDPVDWLESHVKYDPWEQGEKYVAGISFPNGYWAVEPRNAAGDFVFGVCPDRNAIIEELFKSEEIVGLLRSTAANKISFVYHEKVTIAPSLEPEVQEEACSLMGIAIQQALAGPESLRGWKGKLVADRVNQLYCDHLNNHNRAAVGRKAKQKSSDDEAWMNPKFRDYL